MGFVVVWLCKCKSKTCRIQEFPLNYISIMMTLEFCFASFEDCAFLLDPANKNLDEVLAFFHFFLTYQENNVGIKRSFLAFSIFCIIPLIFSF